MTPELNQAEERAKFLKQQALAEKAEKGRISRAAIHAYASAQTLILKLKHQLGL